MCDETKEVITMVRPSAAAQSNPAQWSDVTPQWMTTAISRVAGPDEGRYPPGYGPDPTGPAQ